MKILPIFILIFAFFLTLPAAIYAAPKVYVLSPHSGIGGSGPGIVSSVDINNNFSVTQSVTNLGFPQTFATSPDQSKIYISDRRDEKIYVLNASDNSSIATIDVINDGEILITPDGTKGYIGSSAGIHVLNLQNNTVSGTIPINYTFYGAITPDGKKLLVGAGRLLTIIDTTTDTVISTTNMGSYYITDLIANKDNTKVYMQLSPCCTDNNGSIAVYNLSTGTVTSNITVGMGPEGLALSNNGNRLYTVNRFDRTVSVIDTTTETVISTINLGLYYDTGLIALTNSSSTAYVPVLNEDGSTDVKVIDLSTNTLSRTITLPEAFDSFGIGTADPVGYTTTGTNLNLSPSSGFNLTFDTVSSSGITSIEKLYNTPVVPEGFMLNNDSLYFDITSSATFTGLVEVCVAYTNQTDENNLKLLHEENGVWVDRTTFLDTVNNILCGKVSSFSKFLAATGPVQTTISIDELINKLRTMNVDAGLTNSLVSKLEAAEKDNLDMNTKINILNAFKNAVSSQAGKKLSQNQADILISATDKVILGI